MRTKILPIILAVLLALPMVSAYNSTSDPSVMPIVVSIGVVMAVLVVLGIALAEHHPILSLAFAGITLFLLSPLLQIGETYLTAIDAVSMNVATMITIFTWLDYAIIVYLIVYIFIYVISGYNQNQKEKMEGLS